MNAADKGPNMSRFVVECRSATGDEIATENANEWRYRKELIREGRYIHPATGEVIDVTAERLSRWLANFQRMKANGVAVEVVVDHSQKADDVVGYIDGMEIENGTLFAVHRMKGERGKNLAETVETTSIRFEDFTDGAGNHYGEAITHNAIVQAPVVPAQSGFVRLSINGEPTEIPVYRAHEKGAGNAMEFLQSLQKALGSEAETFDESAALAAVTELASKSKESAEKLAAAEAKVTELSTAKEAAESKATELASKVPANVDSDALDLLTDSTNERIDGMVECGSLIPACADKLKKLFTGKAYLLSRKVSATDAAIAKTVLEIIAENKPVAIGSKTGAQVELSRNTPGAQPEVDAATVEATAKTVLSMIPGAHIQ